MNILHISDLHFGMHRQEIIEPFLSDINKLNPDVIIISGDVTHRATSKQFKQLKKFLNQLPCTFCIVPGNHDIPLHNFFKRVLFPFKKYKKYIIPETYSSFQNKAIRILGVNTATPYLLKDGILSPHSIKKIANYFSPAFSGLNLLFFHHNFDQLEKLHKPLINYKNFVKFLKNSAVDVVSTGHLHYAHVSSIEKSNHRSCVILHAGSLLCQRSKDLLNSYYWLEIENLACKIHCRVFTEGKFQTLTSYDIDLSQSFASLKTTRHSI